MCLPMRTVPPSCRRGRPSNQESKAAHRMGIFATNLISRLRSEKLPPQGGCGLACRNGKAEEDTAREARLSTYMRGCHDHAAPLSPHEVLGYPIGPSLMHL